MENLYLDKTCVRCGQAYQAIRASAMYCSKYCGNRAYYERNKDGVHAYHREYFRKTRSTQNPNSKLMQNNQRAWLHEGDKIRIPLRLRHGHETEYFIINASDVGVLKDNLFWYSNGYAFGWKTGAVHRAIMKATPGQHIDHVNGNRLDDRRSNLRLATNRQNTWNRPGKTSLSGFKGVGKNRQGKWYARIRSKVSLPLQHRHRYTEQT